MKTPNDNRFDSLESAYQYVSALTEVLEETRLEIEQETERARAASAARRIDALRLVAFKLERLHHHLDGSQRALNDLKMLRRLLQSADDDEPGDSAVSYNHQDAFARNSQ